MKNKENEKLVEIFSGTLWEAEMIKSLLESAQINSFLKNHTLNSYAYESGFAEGVKVMILNADSEAAMEIVEDFRST
ncbi:MAG: DUF2007 domain-containing protein [Bacteroidales bacterium]|nr:DUF2007 domain-containing protein [Bacteroidales bacterium]